MGGGAWKVAYADFVTAMMAFFLLMWILNMSSEETKAGLAKYFQEGATALTNISSPVGIPSDNPLLQTQGKMTTQQMEARKLYRNTLAIMKSIKAEVAEDSEGSVTTGMNTDGKGVTLQLTPDLLFAHNSVDLTPQAQTLLDRVVGIMNKYQSYLVVRGHADASETGQPTFPSSWELSAARANAAVKYLIAKGVNPKLVRSIAYADTQPAVPNTVADAARLNGRVEFSFHRPEVMSTITNF